MIKEILDLFDNNIWYLWPQGTTDLNAVYIFEVHNGSDFPYCMLL